MPEARSWPHRGSRLSALMMLSLDRIAFVKPFVEVFITFSPSVPFRPGHRPRRRTHQEKPDGGRGWVQEVSRFAPPPRLKIHRDVTPVARSARPAAAPDRPEQSCRGRPCITCTSAAPSRYPIGRIRRKKAESGREPVLLDDTTAWRFTRTR